MYYCDIQSGALAFERTREKDNPQFSVNFCKSQVSFEFPVVQEDSQRQQNDQIKIQILYHSIKQQLIAPK